MRNNELVFSDSHACYWGITLLLILTFSSVITLIIDIDRPLKGLIQVSQQSLIDLIEKFSAIHKR
jgi:hypothetical protein